MESKKREDEGEKKGLRSILHNRPGVAGHVASTAAYTGLAYGIAKGSDVLENLREMVGWGELGGREVIDVVLGGPSGERRSEDLQDALVQRRILLEQRKMGLEEIVKRKIESGEILTEREAAIYIGPDGETDYVINGILQVNDALISANLKLIETYREKETLVRQGERLLVQGAGFVNSFRNVIMESAGGIGKRIQRFFNRAGAEGYAEGVETHWDNINSFFGEAFDYYKDRRIGNDTIEQLCEIIANRTRENYEKVFGEIQKQVETDASELLAYESKLVEHLGKVSKQLGISYDTEDSIFDVGERLMIYNDQLTGENIARKLEIERELLSGLEEKVEEHHSVVHETREEIGKDVHLEDYNPTPISSYFVNPVTFAIAGGLALKGISMLLRPIRPVDYAVGTVLGNVVRAPLYLGKLAAEKTWDYTKSGLEYVGRRIRGNERNKKENTEE